jgi:hypothetical protein
VSDDAKRFTEAEVWLARAVTRAEECRRLARLSDGSDDPDPKACFWLLKAADWDGLAEALTEYLSIKEKE